MGILAVVIAFVASLLVTPFVIKLAIKIGAVDKPNERKVHTKLMPRLGGLAIFAAFLAGFLVFIPETIEAWPAMLGAIIIVLTGIVDDLKELSAKAKFGGQILAAVVVVASGLHIDFIILPTGYVIDFGMWAMPLTVLWIVGITNAINFIDGLDGLAAGVSSIILATFSVLGLIMGNPLVTLISLILLGSTLGFLVFNFHPAKIFMGDTGSLFLGYMIAVLAVMGLFKNVALFSLIVPIIILGVPIMDTLFAILRRIVQRKPISAPDKSHLHHCFIRLGFTHRQAVIMIYSISVLFSAAAIMFTRATMWGSIGLLVGLLIVVELIVEATGIISEKYRPLLKLMGK